MNLIWWQWLLIILGISIVVVALSIVLRTFFRLWFLERYETKQLYRIKMQEHQYLNNIRKQAELHEQEKKTIVKIIEEKKKRLSNITSVSFHFVDKNEIESFYNDTFREPTFESLVSEITGEVTGEIKGGLPKVLESKIGGRDISRWIRTIKLPDTSLSGMFIKYQKEAIQRGEVTIGLEELDVELNELKEFDSAVENLKKDFGLNIEHSVLETHKSKLRQKAAEKTFAKLEGANGWVLIEGKFLISKNENIYYCSLNHPINKFFHPNDKEVIIMFSLTVESIEPKYAGNYTRSVGKMIPLSVFGKIWQPIDRNAHVYELQITPLAVY